MKFKLMDHVLFTNSMNPEEKDVRMIIVGYVNDMTETYRVQILEGPNRGKFGIAFGHEMKLIKS